MCVINIDGSAVNYTEGMTYIDAIRAANPERADGALAVRVAGIIRGLDEKIQPGADAVTLDFTNEEGRRVYERSLRFVFLLAMHQMYPGKRGLKTRWAAASTLPCRTTYSCPRPR